MSFVSEIMAPGGGVKLIPFVRIVVGLLFACTVCIFIAGVARIHMAILGFLSAGLLVSLQMFETAYNDVQSGRNQGAVNETSTTAQQSDKKTD